MARATTCFVIISGETDSCFEDLVLSIRTFCQGADIAWYNSGKRGETPAGIQRVEPSRPLTYRKATPAFFDVFEWAARQDYDQIVNVETDLAFIRPGFLGFVESQMRDADYLAPGLRRDIPRVSLWPPFRSLAGERAELTDILDIKHLNRCFNPVQVFGRRYLSAVVSSDNYRRVRAFVERNQQPERSWTLQEVLLPSLADSVGVRSRAYPEHMSSFNRFRPYQSMVDLKAALSRTDTYFLHPIRRSGEDPVRRYVRRAVRESAAMPTGHNPWATGLGLDEPLSSGPSGRSDQGGTADVQTRSSTIQATLRGQSFRGADFNGKDLSGQNLAAAMLRGASLVEATLIETNLEGANLSGAFLSAADLSRARLSMAYLGGAFLGWAKLAEADLRGAYLRGADLSEADLRRAILNGADLSGAFLGDANLIGADLRQAHLDGADLREADLRDAYLDGVDLRGAFLAEVKWNSGTRWPDDTRSDIVTRSREEPDGTFVVSIDPDANNHVRIAHPPH